MTTHPWLSRVMFCCGFIVGFSLCFFAICHVRGIPRAQWLHCLAKLCNAPIAESDRTAAKTGPSDKPPVPTGRLLCWVEVNQKVSCYRSFPCCSDIMLLINSTHDPNVTRHLPDIEKQERLHRKSMAAFRTFRHRHNHFFSAADDACVLVRKLRWTLSEFRKRPTLMVDSAFRTCGGRGHTPIRQVALQLVGALQNRSPLEFIQVACCLNTARGPTPDGNKILGCKKGAVLLYPKDCRS